MSTKKPVVQKLTRAERERMAAERQETLNEEEHTSAGERAEIQAEVNLLLNFKWNVGWHETKQIPVKW